MVDVFIVFGVLAMLSSRTGPTLKEGGDPIPQGEGMGKGAKQAGFKLVTDDLKQVTQTHLECPFLKCTI